ncbi:MAG: GlxA family transcriptional regulator [Rhizobiales bacterium]|nr:GlxA family transcriptional regulator [Hyphomicrobiales bacterium]
MTTQLPSYTVEFLLIDNFSMISLASAVEPLRIANKLLGQARFVYHCVSVDGNPVTASSGFDQSVSGQLADAKRADLLVICSSDDVESVDLPASLGAELQKLERHGTALSAICTGTYLLAKYKLLRGRACTIHWEYSDIFRETFPDAELRSGVCIEDRDLLTSSGGTAPLDLMIQIVQRVAGEQVARDVADIAIHHSLRDETVHQRLDARARYDVTNPTFLKCVRLMEANVEEPLSLEELSAHLNISPRQLQRLFKKFAKTGPHAFYSRLRLERAKQMLRRTSMTIVDVALANGFTSTNSFTHAYKRAFGVSPGIDRSSN